MWGFSTDGQITVVQWRSLVIHNNWAADYFRRNYLSMLAANPIEQGLKITALSLLFVLSLQQSIVIRNIGCKAYEKGRCVDCSTRYYLDAEKICQPVNPNCNAYNITNGACLTCYPGFGLIQDTCLPGIFANSFDPNCNTFNGDTCVKCSLGFFLNPAGKCQAVDPTCKSFDQNNGICQSCFAGYELNNGSCVVAKAQSAIPNCNQIDISSGRCAKCSAGYFFDKNGNCQQADPSCKNFDTINLVCKACYDGYELNAGNQCVKAQAAQGDPNCAKYGANNVCQQCSKGAIFNPNRQCIVIDPSCLTFDPITGFCTSCYSGYEIKKDSNICTLAASAPNTNPYCAKWSGPVCQSCAQGSYFDSKGICIVVDANCKEAVGTICNSCYNGYTLQNNTCVKSIEQPSTNSLCAKWNGSICTQCSSGTFLNSNRICTLVNPLCMTFDQNNGNCLSCYQGYSLSGSTCEVSNATSPSDPYCKKFLADDVCSECSDRYYIGSLGVCVEVNPLCHEYDQSTGKCLTCFPGFALVEGNCNVATTAVSDPNCAEFLEGICTKCSLGYVFEANGMCGLVSANCKTFDEITGKCLSCYLGFALQEGACLAGNSSSSAIDPNCAAFAAGVCVRCSKNFYFGTNGTCLGVNPLCQTFDPTNGHCLSCYQSYVLIGSQCAPDLNNTSSDPNCASWLSGVCTSCATRTFMNSQGLCETVNINCNTYNVDNGFCTSCYAGFSLQNGKCSPSTSPNSCSKLDSNGNCLQCGPGSYLSQGQCLTIDAQCANFDKNSLTCTACYSGYSILNGVCQISKVDSKDAVENCYAYDSQSQCIKCFDRYYLSGNACSSVSVFCKTYDGNNGNCLSCYSSFKLINGRCTQ